MWHFDPETFNGCARKHLVLSVKARFANKVMLFCISFMLTLLLNQLYILMLEDSVHHLASVLMLGFGFYCVEDYSHM